MLEATDYKLIFWDVITDKGEYAISEQELNGLLNADANGARFVRLDNVVLNPAFIREIKRRVEHRNTRNYTLSEKDKKYLSKNDRMLLQ